MENISFEANGIGISLGISKNVYHPSDDTRMLSEKALEECFGQVLEIGTGSGAISILLARGGKCRKIIATDINPEAIKCAKENAGANNVVRKISFSQSDLFSKISKTAKFDFILFNPPYLPTSKEEKMKGILNLAFDGGKGGLETVEKFLAQAKAHLKKGGKILMVASSLQNERKISKLILENEMESEIISTRSFFFEKLYVYRMKRR